VGRGVLLAALLLSSPALVGAGEIPSRVPAPRLAAARALVTEAEKDAPGLRTDSERGALRNLARAQAAVGDVAAAQKTFAAVPKSLPDIQNTTFVVHEIAAAQAAAGDSLAALATLAPLGPLAMQSQALEGVVRAEAARGDVAGALRTIASVAAGDLPLTAKLTFAVAEAQAQTGDLAGAVTTVRSVQSPDTESEVRAAVAVAQARSGDVAGALATTRTITGANRVFLSGMLAAYQAKAGDLGRAHDELDLTIPCLVGADTAIGPPLDTFLSGRAAVRADVFGEFFSRVAAALAGA
jgi:hypothetical protein